MFVKSWLPPSPSDSEEEVRSDYFFFFHLPRNSWSYHFIQLEIMFHFHLAKAILFVPRIVK